MAEAQDAESFSPEHARLREHLDQLRNETRPVKWQRRFEKVASSLEELLVSYQAAVEERRTLEQRIRDQTSMLRLLDLEQGWEQMDGLGHGSTDIPSDQPTTAGIQTHAAPTSASHPAPPPNTTPAQATSKGAPPPADGAHDSRHADSGGSSRGPGSLPPPQPPPAPQPLFFLDLPGPAAWRRSWDRRIRSLTSRDLAQLHCEWLQLSAVLVHKADLFGPTCPEHQQLLEYAECYAAFNQHAIRLIPHQWRRRSLYNLKTLEPSDVPPPTWFDAFLSQRCARSKQHLERAFQQYHAQVTVLRQQYSLLVAQYAEVASALPVTVAEGGGADLGGADPLEAGAGRGSRGDGSKGVGMAADGDGQLTAEQTRQPAQQLVSDGEPHASAHAASAAFSAAGRSSSGQALLPLVSSASALISGPLLQGSSFHSVVNAVDDALSALQANLVRQQLVLRQWLYAIRFSDDIVEHIKVHLLLYPQALDVIDFLEASVGGAVSEGPSELLQHLGDAGAIAQQQ